MDLSKIITIAGKSGLFRIIAETRNGFVAESLADGRKIPVFATERTSILEDINIYTVEGEMPLKEIIWKLHEHENGQQVTVSKKEQSAAMAKFEEVLPEYDKERVYFSDVKKVFNWYNILLEKDLISKPGQAEEEAEKEETQLEKQQEDQETTKKEETKVKKGKTDERQ